MLSSIPEVMSATSWHVTMDLPLPICFIICVRGASLQQALAILTGLGGMLFSPKKIMEAKGPFYTEFMFQISLRLSIGATGRL